MSKFGCVCVGVLLWAGVAQAQGVAAVFDSSNFAQNVIQSGRELELVNLALRDLAPLQGMQEALQIATDLRGLVLQAEGIASRLGSRQGLWSAIPTMPTTARGFAELQRSTEAICLASHQDGLVAQSLVVQVPALLANLSQLVSRLQGMLGSVAGLQAANAILASVSGQLSMLTLGVSAANESALCDRWAEKVHRQALDSVTETLIRDYGQLR